MPENAWINSSGYVRVVNMPQYSYNNVIIVTNVIMLEFMYARIIYTQVFRYHFIFFNVS